MKKFKMSFIITFIIALLSLILEISYKLFLSFPDYSVSGIDVFLTYIILSLVFLVLTISFNFKTFLNGIVSLIRLNKRYEMSLSFAALLSLIQLIITLIFYCLGQKLGKNFYSSIVVMSFFFNSYASYVTEDRILKNLKFFKTPAIKKSIRTINDKNKIEKITSNINRSDIAYSQSTKSFKNLKRILYSKNLSDKIFLHISVAGCFFSSLIGIVNILLKSDVIEGLFSATVCSCMCVPVLLKLSMSVPLRKACKKCLKSGAMVSGLESVKKFGGVKNVIIDSTDLYKRRKISLQGMKTFNGSKIDEALISASLVINAVGSPLGHIFSKILKGRHFSYAKCSNVFYEYEKGIVGTVNGKRILVGNRQLLSKYSVLPPPYDEEKKYRVKNQQVTYFAVDDKLVAMFVLSYVPNIDLLIDIKCLEKLGVTFFVRNVDSNITAELICQDFGLNYDSVKIVTNEVEHLLHQNIDSELNEDNAYAMTFGNTKSLFKIISMCIKVKSAIILGIIISITSIVLGFCLIAAIVLYAAADHIGSFELLVYLLLWACCVCIVPQILLHDRKRG